MEHSAGAGLQASLSVSAQELPCVSPLSLGDKAHSSAGDPRPFFIQLDSIVVGCAEKPTHRKVRDECGLSAFEGRLLSLSAQLF